MVYRVYHIPSGKNYIGKKYLWKKVIRPPLKGKKRRRIEWKQSDWQTYTTSSTQLKQMIEEGPLTDFKFDVLCVCTSKGNASYLEAKAQFDHNVLFDSKSFNNIIQCRINSIHVTDTPTIELKLKQ